MTHTIDEHKPAESLRDIISRMDGRFTKQPSKSAIVPRVATAAVFEATPDFIQAETFLENVGYFTPSSKRIRGIYAKEKVFKITLADGTQRICTTQISANHELGLPYTSDLDYYRALQKILDEIIDEAGRLKQPVALPTKKLIRYAGKTASAITRREAREFLQRCVLTGIIGTVYRAKQKDYVDGMTAVLFSQVVFRGERMRNGQMAETNYVWLAPWFLSSYYHRHTRPIDYAMHNRLRKPIAKSLYIMLGNGWYASNGNPYSKSYKMLCDEFLLAKHRQLSLIKQQVNPSHYELQKENYLDRWEYRKAVEGDDYIITYYAGNKFYRDRQEHKKRKELADRITVIEAERTNGQLDLVDRTNILLSDVLAVCGDTQNEPSYRKILSSYSESVIRTALSETRQASLEGRIKKNRGAYFTDTVKRIDHLRKTSPNS